MILHHRLDIMINNNDGVLAQLARAFDWQSKGQRFDSVILHKKSLNFLAVSFFMSVIILFLVRWSFVFVSVFSCKDCMIFALGNGNKASI